MGGRGSGSGFRAGGSTPAASAAAAAPGARAARTVLDFTADTDHYREAQANPREVAIYLDGVREGEYSRKSMTSAGDVFQMLEPDKGSSAIRTGLRAVAMQVNLGTAMGARYEASVEHNGTQIASVRVRGGMAAARDEARIMLAEELRRRGIY